MEGEERPEGYWMRCVQGAVPDGLQGTLFRCRGQRVGARRVQTGAGRYPGRWLAGRHPPSSLRADTRRADICRATMPPPPGLTHAPNRTQRRNGPGKFKIGSDTVQHPYDGDSLLMSVAFPGDGRAYCRSRFVRTAE